MIRLTCPWCGLRNVAEFRWTGESTPRPDPASTTPQEWRAYLHLRANPRGWVDEGWYHGSGCRRYFRLRRHTGSNETRPPDDGR